MASTADQTIVVGTDGSETAERALREATSLARSTDARLVLVSAFSDLHPYRERIHRTAPAGPTELEEVADRLLQSAVGSIEENVEVEAVSRRGDPAEVLADVAQEQGAQLIVVGDRGLSAVKRFLLGSVSNKLAHHAPCNVLIVRSGAG